MNTIMRIENDVTHLNLVSKNIILNIRCNSKSNSKKTRTKLSSVDTTDIIKPEAVVNEIKSK